MSYFTIICFCLLYFLTRLNFALASENAGSITQSKYTRNGDESGRVYLMTRGYRPAEHTLAKYVVSIRRQPDKLNVFGSTHFCSGAILNSKWILTTAHCLERNGRIIRPGELEVVASTPIRLLRTAHSQVMEVNRVKVHNKYYKAYYKLILDIGLLQLKNNLSLDGTYADAIPLPQAPPIVGEVCVSLGFGRLYGSGPYANEILYVNLTIVDSSICEKQLSKFVEGDICVTDANGYEKDSCAGDYGGPLICNGTVAGLFAYGYRCGFGKPTIYTGLYKNKDWIEMSKSGKLGASLWMLRFLSLAWTIIFS